MKTLSEFWDEGAVRYFPADVATFAEWDESKHPRVPAGSDAGGEFTSSRAVVVVDGVEYQNSEAMSADEINQTPMFHGSTTKGLIEFDNARIKGDDADAPFTGIWLSSDSNTSPAFVNPTAIYSVQTSIKNPLSRTDANKFVRELRKEPDYEAKLRASGAKGEGDYTRQRLLAAGYDAVVFSGRPRVDVAAIEAGGRSNFTLAGRAHYMERSKDEFKSYDLYDRSGMFITGYSSVEEFRGQQDVQVAVLDAKHTKILKEGRGW